VSAGAPYGRFPKSAHVRKRREYLAIQASGRRVSLPHFVLVIAARAPADPPGPRLGITASRKVGCAVVRSRIRRLVREAFRATRDLFPSDLDLVVIVKSAPPDFKLAHVIAEWRSAKGQLGKRLEEARAVRRC
jgi:ribonuclease P protein component